MFHIPLYAFGCLYGMLFFLSQGLSLSSTGQRVSLAATRIVLLLTILRSAQTSQQSFSWAQVCGTTAWTIGGFFLTVAALQYAFQSLIQPKTK